MNRTVLALVIGILVISVIGLTTAHESQQNNSDEVTSMFEHHKLMHGEDMNEDEFLGMMDRDSDGMCDMCGMSLEDMNEMHEEMEEHHEFMMHKNGMGCH